MALGIFLFSHVAIARTRTKPTLIRAIGEGGYLVVYSALSIALLVWIIAALLRTPRLNLWPTPEWAHVFALCISALAFVLFGAGAATPNPASISFVRTGYDPAQPGLIGWVRHPIIWAFGLWGLAHIPANGDVATLALFGGAASFSVIGAKTVDQRLRKQMGIAAWRKIVDGPGTVDCRAAIGACLGLAAWIDFLLLHPVFFGVDPLALVLSA